MLEANRLRKGSEEDGSVFAESRTAAEKIFVKRLHQVNLIFPTPDCYLVQFVFELAEDDTDVKRINKS